MNRSVRARASRRAGRWSAFVLVPALLCALVLGARAADEVQVYGVANFGGKNQCGDADMTHPVHTATAAAFAAPFNFLKLLRLWDQVAVLNNGDARGTYWTDASKISSGADSTTNKGADEADVVYIHTHGGHTTAAPWRSSLSMGHADYNCSAATDKMLWNSDLDIAVIKACQSGDYDVWANGGYRATFTESGSPLRMWNAFHGDSSCGDHVTSYVADYANESFFNGVGENWLDEAYDVDSGKDDDDCPVSIVMGSTRAARQSLFENGGWLDRKSTGAKTSSTYFYFPGCDPSSGRALPNN